jgi:cytochrome c
LPDFFRLLIKNFFNDTLFEPPGALVARPSIPVLFIGRLYFSGVVMKRSSLLGCLTTTAALAVVPIAGAHAQTHVTAAEAIALVKKGISFVKANGKVKGYAEISNKSGQFVDRDLYLVVYGLDGMVRAHGANDKMIGKNLIDLKDIDGREFVRERVELARSKGIFWQDYKFTNPTNKKIEPKSMYCETMDDAVLCGGVYK